MLDGGITVINEKVKKESSFLEAIIMETEKVIVVQKYLLVSLQCSLLLLV